ncbi:MAG: hypothetical protein ACPG47_06560 [Leucothrix sp.]
MLRLLKFVLLLILFISLTLAGYYAYKRFFKPNLIPHNPPSTQQLNDLLKTKRHTRYLLGSNTNEIREDNASIPFIDLFKSSIPFADTNPWLSSAGIEYDNNGWPIALNGGVAGTKFLNRLPKGTTPDGRYTVLYEGQGELRYGNDAKLINSTPNRDIIEVQAGSDEVLNASLVISKTNSANPIRNIRVLLPGGICQGNPYQRVNRAADCQSGAYLSFEKHYQTLVFNPAYLNFMKDFRLIRFMNMSGMTRNPIQHWHERNTLSKATWGGKEGYRGAPIEVMVKLANTLQADAWFSMPYQATDAYIKQFASYVNQHLNPDLKVYIEYSNEAWNNIFIHRRHTIDQGIAQKLDTDPQTAGIKFYAQRSVEVFTLWQNAFDNKSRLIRTLASWSANPQLSSQLLSYNQTHAQTDALAIAPYFYADLNSLRKAQSVDDVFSAIESIWSRYGLPATIKQINEQSKLAQEFGVELVAYEGGQHLVDWETRTVDAHPNPLLYAANRDPRMGKLYTEYLNAWNKAGGKTFVHFSAPRIYSWYGSWGAKEYITQPRNQAPKYDALLRFIE